MMKVLTVTGYKPFEMNISALNDPRIAYIKAVIKRKLLTFIDQGLEWILVTGQQGIELWTCEVVFDLKQTYPIRLAIVPPFDQQESRWPESLQNNYQEVLAQADFMKLLYDTTYSGPYQLKAKNSFVINKSDACLCLVDLDHPGSVRYILEEAQAKTNYPVYYITPLDLEDQIYMILDEQEDYHNSD